MVVNPRLQYQHLSGKAKPTTLVGVNRICYIPTFTAVRLSSSEALLPIPALLLLLMLILLLLRGPGLAIALRGRSRGWGRGDAGGDAAAMVKGRTAKDSTGKYERPRRLNKRRQAVVESNHRQGCY